ncbi:MAG: hypothetical protein U0269_18415 [Polyangiales bacterium]
MMRRALTTSALVLIGCGNSVWPQPDHGSIDAALDHREAPVPDVGLDRSFADSLDDASEASDRGDASSDSTEDASEDAAAAGDAASDEALRPPFSRVVFLDTSLLRDTAELERVEAFRIAPHGRGAWSRVQSGPCAVETRIQRAYTPFADTLEVRPLSPEQAPFAAQLGTDERLFWRTYSNVFSEGDRLRITATRSDWTAPWQVELTTPVVALVSNPSWRVWDISYREPIQFRWRSTGVSADASVRVTFIRTQSAGTPGLYDEWELQCDVEPWREQATITLADHPLFPLRPGVDRALVIRVDTVITQQGTLPSGEAVIIETRSNARSIAPNLNP